ncbi:PAS domain S-box protein [Halorussus halophilus]|uniref:PAS domain S-box protein n=1 Tax=Halorussus halophilus TaxID=2650975 RepID=UPI0013018E5D|nr:PAS domain S-box protein [Halorussus halophilus]
MNENPTDSGRETYNGGRSLSTDQLLTTIADHDRRTILAELRRHRSRTLDQLVDAVAATRETDGASDSRERREIQTVLLHVHLPKLADSGLVSYDSSDGVARIESAPEAFDEWLDIALRANGHGYATATADPDQTSLCVLYVDDDTEFGERFAERLEAEDDHVNVRTESDPDAVLSRLAEGRIDCVVSEYRFPETDGLALLKRVRETFSRVPFVLFTDEGSERLASEAFAAGATGYLGRDTTEYSTLVDRVRDAVAASRDGRTYRAIFEQASDGILVLDPETAEIRETNRRVRELLEYDRGPLHGRTLDSLCTEEVPYSPADVIAESDAGGEDETHVPELFECLVETGTGDPLWVELSVAHAELDGQDRVLAFLRDTSARRARERGLYEQQERFRLLVEEVEDYGIFMLDPDGHVVSWNEGAERMNGFTEDEILGEHFSLFYTEEDTDHRPDELLRQAEENGRVEDEGWRVRKDGEKFWVNAVITALTDDGGDLRGFVKVTRDITERKERERRFDAIFNQTYQFTGLMEPDGTLIEANQTALEFGGLDRDDVVGKPIWETRWWSISEDARDRVREAVAEAASGEFVRYEEEVLGADEDEVVTIDFSIKPVTDDDGDVVLLIPEGRDITERKRSEEKLRENERMFSTLLSNLPGMAYRCENDPEWPMEFVSDGCRELTGYDPDELESGEVSWGEDVVHPDDKRSGWNTVQAAVEHREPFTLTYRIRTRDGEDRWIWEQGRGVFGDDELEALEGFITDVTERKRREEQLAALNEVSQRLSDAETEDEVSDVTVEAACETLELSIAVVKLYDDSSGRLRLSTATSEAEVLRDDDSLFPTDWDATWEAFLENEPVVYRDLHAQTDASEVETSLRSVVVLPLGKYGVFVTGSTTADAFSDADIDLTQTLAANVRAALDRVDRERTLRERSEVLAEKNETLERMNRTNEVVRELTQTLTRATSREEIEQAVCDILTDSDTYRFAWVGDIDSVTGEIVSSAWAGVEDGYLDNVVVTKDEDDPSGQGPTGEAVRTREVQVVEDIHTDPPYDPWRKEAIARGYRSSIAVPLVYRDTLYGVLNLYAGEPDALTGTEREVLTELGETVGYAFNAIENKKALASDRVAELEFCIRDPRLALVQYVDETGRTVSVENVLRGEDEIRVFFTVSGAPPEVTGDYAKQSPTLSEIKHISGDEEESLFECTVTDESLVATLLDHGAIPRQLTAESGEVTVVVDFPETGDVRSFVEMVESKYDDAELVARRERDQSVQTDQQFRETLEDRLTNRQLEILRAAYYGGFFEWPRESTGQEIAESLDVSQPTFNRHLRLVERELFSLLLDD